MVAVSRSFAVILLSRELSFALTRLAARIEEEVPEASIGGILLERSSADDSLARGADPVWRRFLHLLSSLGHALFRFLHACPARANGPAELTHRELTRTCETRGWPLLAAVSLDSPEAVESARQQPLELGIVYGECSIPPALFSLPRQGFIRLQQEPAVPGDGEREIALGVRPIRANGEAGPILEAATISLEPFDTPASLALKANLVGTDLLVRAVADLVRQKAPEELRERSAPPFVPPLCPPVVRNSKPAGLARAGYQARRGRPAWKLLLRTLLFFPYALLRNWLRRLRGSFPVTILYHHLVTDSPHPLGIPTEVFLRQVEFLRRHYKIASLGEAIEMLQRGEVRSPTVVLTFDDGYQDNFLGLRAVAEATGIPAAFFVCPQHATAQEEFGHDLQRGQRCFLPLTWEQIAYLSANGFEIGSHTRSHFDCGSLDLESLHSEIDGSKSDLEARLGRPIRYFSFPWGHPINMSPPAVELARRQYPYVFSACGGVNFASGNGRSAWHLRRCAHPNNLWELELTLQSLLDW